MPYISFSEKDRARWGLDEWLEFHPADISIADLAELAELCGFGDTGWPSAFWGEIPFDQAGSPDAKRVRPKWQIHATAWMCLRQNGHKVSWDEVGTAQAGWMRWRNESTAGEHTRAKPSGRPAGNRRHDRAGVGRR